jgi:hypothetical protein
MGGGRRSCGSSRRFSRVRLAGTRPRARRGLGLTWRQLTPRHSSGTWATKIRGTITRDGDGWVAYLRVEDPPGLSRITTVGRYATVEAAQVATDEVWASPVTGEGSGAISTCPAQTGDEPYESRGKGIAGAATDGPQRPHRTATMTAPAASRDAWPAPRDATPTLGV